MESIFERQRILHEEIDRIKAAISKELLSKPKVHRERVKQDHRIGRYLERVMSCSTRLHSIYDSENRSRQVEADALQTGTDLTEFYGRLRAVKEYHRRSPNEPAVAMESEFKRIEKSKEDAELEGMFTGEESYGRFIDLNEIYQFYVNMKGVDPVDYLTYLSQVDDIDSIPGGVKSTAAYPLYLQMVVDYLSGFLRRAQPLLNIEQFHTEARDEAGRVAHDRLQSSSSASGADGDDGLEDYVYCEPCAKLFKRSVYDAHLKGKKHKKAVAAYYKLSQQQKSLSRDGAKQKVDLSSVIRQKREEKKKVMRDELVGRLTLEILIPKLFEAVAEERVNTRAAIERKQTLTLEEYENRLVEEKEEVVDKIGDAKEIEEKFYNPLKLPLGWDGKPIPYWLYKLHGLGIEYPCEICGNFVYMGRKAFERHFKETRHAQNMSALGIPNTRHFREITKIQDALDLWAKMQEEKNAEQEKADVVEEFEDAEGNVFNKKTYEDLRRQGLL